MRNLICTVALLAIFSVVGVSQCSLNIDHAGGGSTSVNDTGSYDVVETDTLNVTLGSPAWSVKFIWRYWILHEDNTLSASGRTILSGTSEPGSTEFNSEELEDSDVNDPPTLPPGAVFLYGGKPVLTVQVDYKVFDPPNPVGHNVVEYDYDNVTYCE